MAPLIRVSLGGERHAVIDESDAELILVHKWWARRSFNTWYACARIGGDDGVRRLIDMHRLIMGKPPATMVDHRDGDGLNNRRSNLRLCTPSQNQQNRRRDARNTSGYRGVTYHKQVGKWQAQLMHEGRMHYLGVFCDPRDAALAYDAMAIERFGDFANLNFPEQTA
jgi:hypothetical protein